MRRCCSWLLLISCLAFASCDYKDLCYDHNHWTVVRVAFDWAQSEQANPQGMTVLFYNEEDPEQMPIRYDLVGRDGGFVKLTQGFYRSVAYNYDTEAILYRNMDRPSTMEAYTRQSSIEEGTRLTRAGMPRAASTESEPVILEPDPLWGASDEPWALYLTNDTTVITLQPEPRVTEVEITIHNVPNLQYTGQFGGALSGLAPGVMMADGKLVDGCVTQAFTCQVKNSNTLYMKFRIFGHCPHSKEGVVNNHLLTIYAILADGSKWYHTLDVTGKMHDQQSATHRHHIDLDLDGLPVPKPIVNGSGFQPTVDGWQGEEIEVTM